MYLGHVSIISRRLLPVSLVALCIALIGRQDALGVDPYAGLAPYLCSDRVPQNVDRVLPYYFWKSAQILNAHPTMSSRQVRINAPTPARSLGHITLFVLCLGPRPPIHLRRYVHNCTYLGDRRSIVCDAQIIEEFLSAEAYARTRSPPQGRENAVALTAWIMAHEIGHLINGDSESRFGVGQAAVSTRAVNAMQIRESKADKFAAELLIDTSVWTRLIGVLSYDLMYAELRKISPDHTFAPSVGAPLLTQQISLFSCGSHPHYVFRAISMLLLDQRTAVRAPVDDLRRSLVKANCSN